MAVRSTMASLISFVRELINDPAGASQSYTDQQIQDRLDLHRKDLYADELEEADSLSTSGSTEWHDFFADLPFWEEGAVIQQTDGVVVAPDDANYLIGKFHYDADMNKLPLLITGQVYDVYGVAADMIMMQIHELRAAFNWTADGTTVQRVTRVRDLTDQANAYRAKSWNWMKQIKLVRKDLRN